MKNKDSNKEEEIIENLGNALQRLKEIPTDKEITTSERDGIIQRFELVFEVTWKAFKVFLLKEGIDANSPKYAIGGAYHLKWIEDEAV